MATAQPHDVSLSSSDEPSGPVVAEVFDDGLSPPTKAQVYYWRELCGVATLHGAAGVRDDQWPPELAPSTATLRALVERGLFVRRRRAWRLRRDWYTRVGALRARAVPTPPLTLAERPGPNLPSYAELERWETVCRWLDAQPRRRARLPFAGLETLGAESALPLAELTGMRKYRLVRHTSACAWALSPTWQERLRALWQGVARVERELDAPHSTPSDPRSLVAGIDTWYLNRLGTEPLPARLRQQLDDLQAQAREEEQEVDTPWVFDGAALRMYRAGVNAAQGGGVSWSYVLRNRSLALLICKAPLGQVIAQARLGSECLWRLTDRGTLDEVDRLVRRLWWTGSRRDHERRGRWQVSQVHLAHDVSHAPLAVEQLGRYVSRSRRQAVYEAGRQAVQRLLHDLSCDDVHAWDDFALLDWEDGFGDDEADAWWGLDDLESDRNEPVEVVREPVQDRAVVTHRWGQRLSGITWSPGGAIAFVQYDKVLQSRLSGKRHMESLWRAQGWTPGEGVTRHEARLRRDALRVLRLPGETQPCLDDPWQFLEHKQDVWAAVVGQVDGCPEAVSVAWIRRVAPDAGDANRSRWPTDPTWRVVQAASFSTASTAVRRLIRRQQRVHDIERLDRQTYGLLVSRVAERHPEGGQWAVSMALSEVVPALQRETMRPGKDFGELVRERQRQRGLSLPVTGRILPALALMSFVADPVDPILDQDPTGTDSLMKSKVKRPT